MIVLHFDGTTGVWVQYLAKCLYHKLQKLRKSRLIVGVCLLVIYVFAKCTYGHQWAAVQFALVYISLIKKKLS